MKKVLILCAHRPKRSPSQRYRFEQYLPFLNEHGFSFTYSYLLDEKTDPLFYSKGNFVRKVMILVRSVFTRLKDKRGFRNFDIIFIQREALFLGSSFFEKSAARAGAYIIFDFDDSIWLADTSPGNKKWEWIKRPGKFFSNIQHANCVIAGNSYLAEKALPFNSNTVIIPTTIDTDIHIPMVGLRNKGPVVVGWSGSISTIKHFNSLIPVLKKIREKYGQKIIFRILADKVFANDILNPEVRQWTEATEVSDLNSFDIGIMPLPDDEWSKGKCGLKGLSYMACGVATIMSPVGVNTEIIHHGENGFLAGSEEEWLSALSQLIEDTVLRERLGKAGRKTVEEKYSVTANREKYLKVFSAAQNISL